MGDLDSTLDALDQLVAEVDRLVDELDSSWVQQQTDWMYFRLGTIEAFSRQRTGGAVAATMARGLLEQAAYIDWAQAAGVLDHPASLQAVDEMGRLTRAADPDDRLWLGWVIPPDVEFSASAGGVLPASASDAVKRVGHGLSPGILSPLRVDGLFASYRALELIAHGNIAGALVLQPGGGEELPDPFAAAIAHVTAAGVAGSVIALSGCGDDRAAPIVDAAVRVAGAAVEVHGLGTDPARAALRAPKTRPVAPARYASGIDRMPGPSAAVTAAASVFLDAAAAYRSAAAASVRTGDRAAVVLCWPTFEAAWGHLRTVRGVVDGTIGAAMLPFAARPLLEEGTRWGWIRDQAATNPDGGSIHALVADGRDRVAAIRKALSSDGLKPDAIDHFLGEARQLEVVRDAAAPLPKVESMFASANPTRYEATSAQQYSLLSQFVHATPIGTLHLQLGEFTSLSGPMHAVAVEAACRGFWNLAVTLAPVMCHPDADLSAALGDMTGALSGVVSRAAMVHCMG